MAITAFLGKTFKEYRERSREYLSKRTFFCTKCESAMGYHGRYLRNVRDNNEKLSINRLCCRNKNCRHTEAVLPDFLLPRKQYSADEIEVVLMDSSDATAEQIDTLASVSTVRRWIKQFNAEIMEWIIILVRLTPLDSSNNTQNKAVLQDDVSNPLEQLELLIKNVPVSRKSGNILGAALAKVSELTSVRPICITHKLESVKIMNSV